MNDKLLTREWAEDVGMQHRSRSNATAASVRRLGGK